MSETPLSYPLTSISIGDVSLLADGNSKMPPLEIATEQTTCIHQENSIAIIIILIMTVQNQRIRKIRNFYVVRNMNIANASLDTAILVCSRLILSGSASMLLWRLAVACFDDCC